MHEIKLSDLHDDKTLTLAVLQISQMLGLYQAELARVLGLQCGDISALASGKLLLSGETDMGEQARLFVSLYEYLYQYCDGEAVAIYHWLRAQHPSLSGAPLLLMVDQGRLSELVAWLKTANTRNCVHAGEV